MPKRSYFTEITELESTWDAVWSLPSLMPQNLDAGWLSGAAFCIGSGGSLSLAKMWQQIHESHNLGFAKTITPYEYYHTQSIPDIIVLFSASGKNHDILQVFKLAIANGCRVLVFTATQNSALFRLSVSHADKSHVICSGDSTPKDGFLAVNSVIALSCLMARVENKLFGQKINIISPVSLALKHRNDNPLKEAYSSEFDTIQIISSERGGPAGYDLESRLAESGICSCFLTDPRNFGHGRFLWLEKRRATTLIVIFHTVASKRFLARFQRTFPADCQIYHICAPYENVFGTIYCTTRSIALFGDLSKLHKIDPGKPHVPQWGRKLHSLHFTKIKSAPVNKTDKAQSCPALFMKFSGIVADFDGTLVDTNKRTEPIRIEIIKELIRLLELGLKIGIATGRGQSVLEPLKNKIPSVHHKNILIGLYNGTQLLSLSDAYQSTLRVWPLQTLICSITKEICKKKTTISSKLTQFSIREGTIKSRNDVLHEIYSRLGQYSRFIKHKKSGHSIDIFPNWASKLTVVEAMAESVESDILCMGDQGQAGGNDEELLSWKPAISVGKKRPVSDVCLWLGHDKNYQESSGALLILKNIQKKGSLFNLNL